MLIQMIILNTPGMFGYKFDESRSYNSISYGYHPNFTSIYHFLEKRVVKN